MESNRNGELLVAVAKSDYPRVVGLRYHRGVDPDDDPQTGHSAAGGCR